MLKTIRNKDKKLKEKNPEKTFRFEIKGHVDLRESDFDSSDNKKKSVETIYKELENHFSITEWLENWSMEDFTETRQGPGFYIEVSEIKSK
jgi:hypothetical protein